MTIWIGQAGSRSKEPQVRRVWSIPALGRVLGADASWWIGEERMRIRAANVIRAATVRERSLAAEKNRSLTVAALRRVAALPTVTPVKRRLTQPRRVSGRYVVSTRLHLVGGGSRFVLDDSADERRVRVLHDRDAGP
jgi:hypothetical protein